MVLTVALNWRKLGEMTRNRIQHEAAKDKEDAVWKTQIEAKLQAIDTKIDTFSRLEKSNIESIQSLRESTNEIAGKITKLSTDLITSFKRVDELRTDYREIREYVTTEFRRINDRIYKTENTCPKNGACRE
jgi:uncharacterized coiled-coil DUF342 family protein